VINSRRLACWLTCFAAFALTCPGQKIISEKISQTPLAIQLTQTDRPLIMIESEQVPGLQEAVERLQRPTCAVAVGGEHSAYAAGRMLTATYFRFMVVTISAQKKPNGSIEVVYALSYVEARRVLLFPAFLAPQDILTRLATGGAIHFDSIPDFERSHGLRPRSVTRTMLQALYLLHEHAHLNGAAIDDLVCPLLSMLNTRRIAEACYPEIVDVPPQRLAPSGDVGKLYSKVAGAGSKGCRLCHAQHES
jgi:hypothetical protein